MRFEVARDNQHQLGARIEDVAQEAIDATALAYANDAAIDVDQHLRAQLSSRGIAAADTETLAEIQRAIRAGHPSSVGRSDGSLRDRSGATRDHAGSQSASTSRASRLLRALRFWR
jgi:hypothetical protein